MVKNVGVGAAPSFFEGIGKDGQFGETSVVVDRLGEASWQSVSARQD